jgi:tetratricopeptide (TPR) repeat protein
LKSPFKNAYGHEDARTKNVVSWLAFAYGKLSQNDKAIALLQSELLKLEISHNCHSERYLNFNLNLAYLYKDREQWDNVIPLLQRDFEICKKLYGPMHTKTLESLNRLAWVYAKLSKWNQVVKLDLQVLMGYEKIFGISHFETHSSIKCLAYTYEKMEEWEKSLSLRLRSLKIVENHYGTNHLETARSLEELAGVYEHLHQFDNALPLLQRAIEIRGENNVEAKYLFNMAGMMEILCHFELAKELRNRTYANAILSACCEAKLFEDFDRIGQAVSVCMETWSNWETIEPPKNLEAKNALLEFSETLQRLRLNGNTSETIGITEAIQNILIKIEFLTDALVSLAIDKANELIGQYSLEVTEDNYNIIYWAEHEIYPAAHHSVFGYLKHLLKGGEVNERFEQASMKNDFNMKAINVAALIFLVAKEREIPYERVLNYLKSHLPESEVSIPAIFQKIMVIYPAMNEAGLMGEIKCLAGVVCGAILDSDQFSYNAAQINEDFDKVGLIVKFCNGLES